MDVLTQTTPVGARRGVRRAVDFECELVRASNDRAHRYRVTNLSHDGLWLNTPNPARAGEVVVVCFRPTEGWDYRELHVFSEVVRVTSVRHRPGEIAPDVGMGLELLDLSEDEQARLRRWLSARRQPLARRRRPVARAQVVAGPPPPAPASMRASEPVCWR